MSLSNETIIQLLKEKSTLKQDVYHLTIEMFNQFKRVLESTVLEIQQHFGNTDSRVEFYYKNKGDLQAEIKIAGDILIFQMHTNVFQFDKDHSLWKSGYLANNQANSYVGIINIYNFLSDSFKYNRESDLGYLMGRIFINREKHFLVQGKKQMGYAFNDFMNAELNEDAMKQIIEHAILSTLEFDLFIPPYEALQQLTVEDVHSMNHGILGTTGKRLGFQFGYDHQSNQ